MTYLLKGFSTGLNDRIGDLDTGHTARVCRTGISVRDILVISLYRAEQMVAYRHELQTQLPSIQQRCQGLWNQLDVQDSE
jgi:hypothetical protein